MHRKRFKKSHSCANCGFEFKIDLQHNNYCPNCGQSNHTPRQPLLYYISELIQEIFNFDNRTWFSLYTLICRPGTITKDFIENRRARYTSPVKLFFFSLACFILLIEISQSVTVELNLANESNISLSEHIDKLPDSSIIVFPNPYLNGEKTRYQVSFLKELRALKPGYPDVVWLRQHHLPTSIINRLSLRYVQKNLNSKYSIEEFPQQFIWVHYWLILIMIPIVAFFIFIVFYHKNLLFYDTLTFTIHVNVFALLTGTVLAMVSILLLESSVINDMEFILPVNLILVTLVQLIPAYKKVFGLSWVSTILRGCLLTLMHFIAYNITFLFIMSF